MGLAGRSRLLCCHLHPRWNWIQVTTHHPPLPITVTQHSKERKVDHATEVLKHTAMHSMVETTERYFSIFPSQFWNADETTERGNWRGQLWNSLGENLTVMVMVQCVTVPKILNNTDIFSKIKFFRFRDFF